MIVPFVRVPDFDERAARVLCRGFCVSVQLRDVADAALSACESDNLKNEPCIACQHYTAIINKCDRMIDEYNERIKYVFGRSFKNDVDSDPAHDVKGMVDFLRMDWREKKQPHYFASNKLS